MKKALVISGLAMFLVACSQIFYVKIVDISDWKQIKFCVSTSRYCTSWSSGPNILIIHKLDESDGYQEKASNIVWYIEKQNNDRQIHFVYGIVPNGWREHVVAKPFQLNSLYYCESGYFIAYQDSGSVSYFVNNNKNKAIKFLKGLQ